MAIYITGDIHGNPVRLGVNSFYEQKEFDKDNKDENIVIYLYKQSFFDIIDIGQVIHRG